MQTKITFANEAIDLDTLHHENMHQWWGDNVSEANYNLTFFKEGLATLGEFFFSAANAQAAAGGSSCGVRAEPRRHASTRSMRAPTPCGRARPRTRARPRSSPARGPTLGRGSRTSRCGGSSGRRTSTPLCSRSSRPTARAASPSRSSNPPSRRSCPSRPPRAGRSSRQFFTQWWDTVYPPGGGDNRPQITAPGLDGGGFSC